LVNENSPAKTPINICVKKSIYSLKIRQSIYTIRLKFIFIGYNPIVNLSLAFFERFHSIY
ncbi:MAG: hypothetical protein ACFE91_16330, partial [Promethearchaeota archaeon]